MNLPNWLTVSRISSVPLLVWILATNQIGSSHGEKELLASAVVVFAAITDRLDGYLARKRGQITRMGMLLDPLADKLLIVSALIALMQFNPRLVSAWVVIAVVARELLVTELRMVGAAEGFTIQARDLGKWKMAVQVVAVIAAILDHRWPVVHLGWNGFSLLFRIDLIAKIAIWSMVVLSVASAADYFVIFWKKIDQAHKRQDNSSRVVQPRRFNAVEQDTGASNGCRFDERVRRASTLYPTGTSIDSQEVSIVLNNDSPAVLIFIEDGYEDMELMYPKYRLEEAGFKAVVAGPNARQQYLGKHGYPRLATHRLLSVDESAFVGVICPGGWAPDKLRRIDKVKSLVAQFNQSRKLIAAICHGGWIPISAGVYGGVRVTGSLGIKDDLINAGAIFEDSPVVS